MQTVFEITPDDHGNTETTYRNFYEVEGGFIWTRSAWGEVEFELKSGVTKWSRATLEIDLDVFRPPETRADEGNDCFIFLNGVLVGCLNVIERTAMVFALPSLALNKTTNRITLQTERAVRPEEYGIRDTRLLGIKFFSMRIMTE